MTPHALAQAPAAAPEVDGPAAATYGQLMDLACQQVALAITDAQQRLNAGEALGHLLGVERLLRTTGQHLRLLVDTAALPSTQVHALARRLSGIHLRNVPQSRWADATATFGAAHDLTASHLSGTLPRTPEADILAGPASLHASARLVSLQLDVHAASAHLIDRYVTARIPGTESPSEATPVHRLRGLNADVELLGKAAMWDLTSQLAASRSTTTLDNLQTAATPASLLTASPGFERSMAALRLLNQLSFRQAKGQLPASPASLRDLALLGAAMTDPYNPLPERGSGLARVRVAHARDQLNAAHIAWREAGRDLTLSIQGVTKAPTSFRAAFDALTTQGEPPFRVRSAVMASLPRLAREATQTIATLAENGSLLTRQQEFCQPRKAWRPITAAQAADLACQFQHAADRTHASAVTLADLERVPATSLVDSPNAARMAIRDPELIRSVR